MLGLIGVGMIFYSTRWGIGIAHDSFGYLSGAENLLRGQGYSHVTGLGEVMPTNQWPPLFSLAITPFGFAGLSISEGARWLNALLFGINILLIGYFVYRNTTFWPAIFASLIILTSVDLIRLHATAYSEPLYFFLGLCGLYWLDKYINTAKTFPLLISALIIGAAALTRYIGVTLIVTLCVSILVLGKRSLKRRLADCCIAGVISSLPLTLFAIRNVLVSGRVISYLDTVQTRLITAGQFMLGLDTISLWFLPATISFRNRMLVLGVAVLALVLITARFGRTNLPTFWSVNLIYVFAYLLSLTLAIVSVEPHIAYDAKYLSPVFVSIVIILALFLHGILLRAPRPVRIGLWVFLALFCISAGERAVVVVKDIHQNGLGFEAPELRQSKIMSSIKNLPVDVRIYASLPILVRFFTQRDIRELPWKYHPATENPVSGYLPELHEIQTSSRSQRTLIVYHRWRPYYYPTENDLKQVLSLKEIASAPDGTIYEVLP